MDVAHRRANRRARAPARWSYAMHWLRMSLARSVSPLEPGGPRSAVRPRAPLLDWRSTRQIGQILRSNTERKMIVHGITPILNVSDINASFDWFAKLGWTDTWQWDDPPSFGS